MYEEEKEYESERQKQHDAYMASLENQIYQENLTDYYRAAELLESAIILVLEICGPVFYRKLIKIGAEIYRTRSWQTQFSHSGEMVATCAITHLINREKVKLEPEFFSGEDLRIVSLNNGNL